ncbi:MAG: transglutaminase family protein [Candidatus Dojkabacteria bacterium]|jgi:transglutaminase-like putative cysteine protease|nr:transglutaminase family protein [Candidatus Dojkabacteria bacterium]
MKKNLRILISLSFILSLCTGVIFAQDIDFNIQNNSTISYESGKDFVTVSTEYVREVKNSAYFYSTQGEKIFHIPDLPKTQQYELELERQFKIESLKVTNGNGKAVTYSIQELESGEGIYVKVPNYRQTTYGNPYKVVVQYQTHDLIKKVIDHVVILAPALHEDTQFEQTDSESGTKTSLSYDLKVVTDSLIPPLTRIYPEKYIEKEEKDGMSYLFKSQDRVGNSPYLEFGTKQIYKFELKYKTPKTDNLVPEKYSSLLNALSTNIYEISLPREFSETNQRVKIESIYPAPARISKDSEGNIIAKFEVRANKSSEISITGYIWLEQEVLEERREIPNPTLQEYKSSVTKDSNLNKYLASTTYWEVTDSYIKEQADTLLENTTTLMDVIKSDYRYINERLDYDENKANSENERIGARAALQGGGSVCMEYADSMIAILRAQGIPSRAALGYSNLNVLEKTNEDGSTRHQWVQVWIPEYGWLSIDPTYESENMLIGQNIEKVLWETFYDEELTNIKIYSADSVNGDDFSDYSVKIYAVQSTPQEDTLREYSDIKAVEDANVTALDTVNTFVKTTSLGKALVILLPIFIILIALISILVILTSLVRRFRTRKAL